VTQILCQLVAWDLITYRIPCGRKIGSYVRRENNKVNCIMQRIRFDLKRITWRLFAKYAAIGVGADQLEVLSRFGRSSWVASGQKYVFRTPSNTCSTLSTDDGAKIGTIRQEGSSWEICYRGECFHARIGPQGLSVMYKNRRIGLLRESGYCKLILLFPKNQAAHIPMFLYLCVHYRNC
jgi:hypothetical protein